MALDQHDQAGNSVFARLLNAGFEIGGDDQLAGLRTKYASEPGDEESARRLRNDWERLIADLQIRSGTILKSDTVSLLLGAGASKECGGPLIGTIPLEVERALLKEGITANAGSPIAAWLECFYTATKRAGDKDAIVPTALDEILARHQAVMGNTAKPLRVNLESLLSLLYRWRATLPKEGGYLWLDGRPSIYQSSTVIEECLRHVTMELAKLCQLPAQSADQAAPESYKDLLRKILTRPLNLKRANIFTLNYDTLVEQAADADGVVLIDGFVGTMRRTFRPESYDHDLYFPAETTEGRVHRLDRVLHLFKLHGSLTWTAEEPSWDNPYGIQSHGKELPDGRPVLIYPTPAKWGEALGMPYAELLRRFAATIVRPQSVLLTIGYGFGDEHICAIVRQALAIPSFTLVVIDPTPQSACVTTARAARPPGLDLLRKHLRDVHRLRSPCTGRPPRREHTTEGHGHSSRTG